MILRILFIVYCLSFVSADDEDDPKNYKDFKLIRINPESEDSLSYLKALYEGESPYSLDFWQPPTRIGALVDVSVSPLDAPIFVRDLTSKNLKYIVAINDLDQAIQNERSTTAWHHPIDGFSYDKYNSLVDIHDELKRLKREHPDLVTLIDIGTSHENRTLLVIKLKGRRNVVSEKPAFWIDAGIHAREWIAPATAMYTVRQLINGYDTDPQIQSLLDSVDFYVLPVMNPDGYEYSRITNRMWRKNRRPATCKRNHFHTICCAGVDLNRNFDWFFGSRGTSNDPCHETYHGPQAFSEPETQAVRDFLEAHKPKAFVTLHSYSQMWLIPFGHRKRSYPQDYNTALRPLALRATKALYDLYGTKYQVGTGADLMYEAAGGSHDWAKGNLKVPYAYLVELRPKNTMFGNGFLLPEREIPSTGLETWEAIRVVADELVGQFVQPVIRNKVVTTTAEPEVKSGERRGYKIIETTRKEESTKTFPTTTAETSTLPTTRAWTRWRTKGAELTKSSTSSAGQTTGYSTQSTTTTSTTSTTSTTTTTSSTTTTTTTTTTTITTTRPTLVTTTTSPTTTTTESATSVFSILKGRQTTTWRLVTPKEIGLSISSEVRIGSDTTTTEKVPSSTITSPTTTLKTLNCVDYGSYCQLWGILQLCDKRSVQKLCTKTCHSKCRYATLQ
ncbi:unnamed protein product, partial [Mesorhabditis belari]|uniref:Zinc carboxypeptidase A 1 n=1 Tax=Mesorhabditis belari TaxID=2138241 RepID=A0AAF3FEB2_9BILA